MDVEYIQTTHFKDRWSLRFNEYDFDDEWRSAKKATSKQKKIINTHCVVSTSHRKDKDTVYYISSRNSIVFVCNEELKLIITVMPYVETVKAKPMTKNSYREYKHNRRHGINNGNN